MKNKIQSIWYDSVNKNKKRKKSTVKKGATKIQKKIAFINETVDDYCQEEIETLKTITKTDFLRLSGKEILGGLPSLGKRR